MDPIWTGLAALLLGAIHLEARRLSLAGSVPRSRWLSAAGGISVAYVFLHLLPEIGALERHLTEGSSASGGVEGALATSLAYLVALAGFVVFYGLERAARRARRGNGSNDGANEDAEVDVGVFRLHVLSFALYNLLVGYLLVHEADGLAPLLLYTLAMALHFVVNDAGLREHHARRYHRVGRWVLAVAVLGGWGAAQTLTLSEAVIGGVVAFLAGGIVLNVIKEELPEERSSSFPAFALGAGLYGALLLLV